MIKRMIPAEEAFADWRKEPAYQATYDALEEEFTLARAFIEARSRAHLTQETSSRADGNDTGCRRTPREWASETINPYPRALCRCDWQPSAHHLRATTALICEDDAHALAHHHNSCAAGR